MIAMMSVLAKPAVLCPVPNSNIDFHQVMSLIEPSVVFAGRSVSHVLADACAQLKVIPTFVIVDDLDCDYKIDVDVEAIRGICPRVFSFNDAICAGELAKNAKHVHDPYGGNIAALMFSRRDIFYY